MIRRLDVYGLVTLAFLLGAALVFVNMLAYAVADEAAARDELLEWVEELEEEEGKKDAKADRAKDRASRTAGAS